MVLTLDSKTQTFVSHMTSHVYSVHWTPSGQVHINENSAKFRSPQFHIISNTKMEAVGAILKLGYNVLFIDPDIAVRNVFACYIMYVLLIRFLLYLI